MTTTAGSNNRDNRANRANRADRTGWADWTEVPAVAADAQPDPHFAELRGGWSLPVAYLPPAMAAAGTRPGWMKLAAWGLIALFLTATTGGICLTYGPGS